MYEQEGMGLMGGAAAGAMAGSVVPGIGTAIGAVVGGALGFLQGRSQRKAAQRQLDEQERIRIDGVRRMMSAQNQALMSMAAVARPNNSSNTGVNTAPVGNGLVGQAANSSTPAPTSNNNPAGTF